MIELSVTKSKRRKNERALTIYIGVPARLFTFIFMVARPIVFCPFARIFAAPKSESFN